MSIESPENVKW